MNQRSRRTSSGRCQPYRHPAYQHRHAGKPNRYQSRHKGSHQQPRLNQRKLQERRVQQVFFHLKGFYSKRTALLPKGSKALRNPCAKLRQILSDIAKTKSFSMFHATRMGLGAAIIMLCPRIPCNPVFFRQNGNALFFNRKLIMYVCIASKIYTTYTVFSLSDSSRARLRTPIDLHCSRASQIRKSITERQSAAPPGDRRLATNSRSTVWRASRHEAWHKAPDSSKSRAQRFTD